MRSTEWDTEHRPSYRLEQVVTLRHTSTKDHLSSYRQSPSMSYVIAIDQGTSSTRAIIFDHHCLIMSCRQKEHEQIYPAAGYVEHDPLEIWQRAYECVNEAMEETRLTAKDIVSLGITNQRETTLVWNKRTGKPYHNAIVWNDSRTAEICER